MVHVSPHGMPSGGSKGSGGDSLGSVLLMILILGGAVIGGIFLLGRCSNDETVRVDAGSTQAG